MSNLTFLIPATVDGSNTSIERGTFDPSQFAIDGSNNLTITSSGNGPFDYLIMRDPSSALWHMSVDNSGAWVATPAPPPIVSGNPIGLLLALTYQV